MFREMRRKNQALTREECAKILERGTSGVLALAGDADYPYAVPLSYVYDGARIYFHCAQSGHKLDCIHRKPQASFCVVAQDQVVPEEYTTYYRSVIVFGTLCIIQDDEERRTAIEKLAIKYAPNDNVINRQRFIEREWQALCMLEMNIEYLSGKEAIEIKRAR